METTNNYISYNEKPSPYIDSQNGRIEITSGYLKLVIETQYGLDPCILLDMTSGRSYADGDYIWPKGEIPKMLCEPVIESYIDGSFSVILKGQLDQFIVEQSFAVFKNEPGVIIETITVTNPTEGILTCDSFRCGFSKKLYDGKEWLEDIADLNFCPVPYRRETDGKMKEFPLKHIKGHGMTYRGWAEEPVETNTWGSEAWVISNSKNSFLISKYCSNALEWSLLNSLEHGKEVFMCFGGAGQWKHGCPEGFNQLEAGKSFTFGETRFQIVEGNWKNAYYAYRSYTKSKGCLTPENYNPPVHWNELYDNEYYYKAVKTFAGKEWFDNSYNIQNKRVELENELLNKFYTLEHMKSEAEKAKEFGCEALYLDPGWDTGSNTHIWDAKRLGSLDSFLDIMHKEYCLRVSLWIGIAGVPPTYSNPEVCPLEARVKNKDGKATDLNCVCSPSFINTKVERLSELCRKGIAFLMIDSNQYTGPCYDETHGHSVPSRREEHAKGLLEIVQKLKKQWPQVLFEMHDFITGPSGIHYTQTYFLYDKPYSFDCLWGHEFMWDPMKSLKEKKAISLYYYNLAYSIPLYLHINLKTGNENALVFWWYASTCRHLGVGGKHNDPEVWEAQKYAMFTYLALKQFYTQGIFYGLDEMVHAHTLPDIEESVINIFNLEDVMINRQISIRAQEIGLPARNIQVEGCHFTTEDDEIIINVEIEAMGHQLLKLKAKTE